MNTILYIDGFNFYYSAVKDTPFKWLNPLLLAQSAFPRNTFTAIRYFTARVHALPNNPGQPLRQQMYWRALQTLPNLDIIEGDFRTRQTRMAVVTPPPVTIEVFKVEEKGSDVNIAAHLLMDGFRNRYQAAIVISGDSDLVTPIRMVKEQLKKPVGVLNPQRLSGPNCRKLRRNAGLKQAATFYQNGVTWAQLQSAQFPDTLTDANGTIHKPPCW